MDVVIDNNGVVISVSIHHQVPKGGVTFVQDCPEIVECLKKQDFDLFVKHLEGLNNVYKLNCTVMEKSRAWQVLCNLEEDIIRLYKASQNHNFPKDLNRIIHKTRLGLVEPRAGGLPMKLRIFISPFQLIDVNQKKLIAMSQNTVVQKDLGLSLSVGIQSSTKEHILPLSQAISNQGEELNLSGQNCAGLPACFVLSVSTPLPISIQVIKHIENVTGIEFGERGGECESG